MKLITKLMVFMMLLSCAVTMAAVKNYRLSVTKSGSGTVSSSPAGINCGRTCSANFAANTPVTLTATPTSGSSFSGWTGSVCSGTSPTCLVSMTTNKSVTATFVLKTYALSVSKSGDGSGTVSSSPAGINCGSTCTANFTANSNVTLTASPASGSSFSGWGGVCNGTVTSCTVSMGAAKSVTAQFTKLPSAGAMVGAYVDSDGWNTGIIDAVNSVMVKPLAVVNLFSNFEQNWGNLSVQATNIVSRNAVPMITWMPSVPARPSANLLGEISNGQWNTYLDTWISGLKAWQATYPLDSRPTVLIRFAHEFNGNWYSWGNDPNGLKTAWAYLRNRFTAAGVTGVQWVWCANNNSVDSYNDITRYYPGDALVDWTALDGYNWGSNYSFSQWKGFAETFSAPYTTLVTNYPTKPIMLAEVASAEPTDVPNATYGQDGNDNDANQSKVAWVQDMYTRIMNEYPAIRAVVWFNTNKELSWALTGAGNTGLTAYNNVVANSYYSGAFIPLSQATTSLMAAPSVSLSSTTLQTSVATTSKAGPTQKALALSRKPAVVGAALLQREAQGFRSLGKQKLDALKAVKRREAP